MINNNEKGFALVLSLVLMLVMSLMGGALIVISAGDHQSNNRSDDINKPLCCRNSSSWGRKICAQSILGPWNISNHQRDMSKRNLPNNTVSFPTNMTQKNYNSKSMSSDNYLSQSDTCYNSFQVNKPKDYKVVVAESWNFGVILDDSIGSKPFPRVRSIN